MCIVNSTQVEILLSVKDLKDGDKCQECWKREILENYKHSHTF